MDKTHEELATRLKAENEELRKLNKLLYRSLKEIYDLNNAIISDTDDKAKTVGAPYLNGFINAKVSSVEEFIRGCYQEDSNDREETQSKT